MNKKLGGLIVIALIVIGTGIYYLYNQSQHSKQVMEHNHKVASDLEEKDRKFLDGMIAHHIGGVEMAKEAQSKSKRSEITELSTNIITAQEKEIATMYEWRKNWYNDSSRIEMNSMDHSMSMMQDLGAADADFDLRYIDAMTEHHQGAVDMSKDILRNTKKDEIKTLANNIIRDQEKEIEYMKSWKAEWYKE